MPLSALTVMMKSFSLFSDQSSVISRLYAAWQQCAAVMVQMPTGTGKTHVLAAVAHDFVSRGTDGGEVWIVAHRRELVEQIEETLRRYGLPSGESRVRALSIQWLVRHWDEMAAAPGLIVIDEAHHALADSYVELWRRFPKAKKLGMTATPCRLNGRGFTDLFEHLVVSPPIIDFIRRGRLAKYDYISIAPDCREQHLIDGLRKRGADGDYQVKEMGEVLNRRVNIAHLYQSLSAYADGKKGIVYAIDIAHARNIARYYAERGLRAVAIDSRTPAVQRKAWVTAFRAGEIDVLVNVDVFSEGFDCPDVEFVQMARPTLSLAKYLQQVGRGLRVSPGKGACVLIDNVGLYRAFGLPTEMRNWEQMFLGRQAGKGIVVPANAIPMPADAFRAWECVEAVAEDVAPRMVVVMAHDRLLAPSTAEGEALTAFRTSPRGLWGLRSGHRIVCDGAFRRIISIRDGYAVARRPDGRLCVIGREGRPMLLPSAASRVSLRPTRIARVAMKAGPPLYIDLRNGAEYSREPRLFTTGRFIELLLVDRVVYSRTGCRYTAPAEFCRRADMGFYLLFRDRRPPDVGMPGRGHLKFDDGAHYVCLLPHDYATYYYLCESLADGSIIVMDARDGAYYRLADGREKVRIEGEYTAAMAALKAAATRAIVAGMEPQLRLEPFQVSGRWGLKYGRRVVCAPKYRMVNPPVGGFCAFQSDRRRWGVLGRDGRVKLPANYVELSIHPDGTAEVAVAPGSVRTVRLTD